ncbi:MAG: four helix bundle protein [Candidatus Acidiferrales bacterium]
MVSRQWPVNKNKTRTTGKEGRKEEWRVAVRSGERSQGKAKVPVISEKPKVRSYRDLIVWQKAMDLVRAIYNLTASFPVDERFGLISQIRRAAVSVPSNIAEGQARHTSREFVQFISHAEGSLAEVDTQLTLSNQLRFCEASQTAEISSLIEEIRKMLMSLRGRLDGQRK